VIGRLLRAIGWRELCWLALGLVLIVAMRKSLLGYADKLAPVPVPAEFKQRVVTRDFAITADGFSLARRYKTVGSFPDKDAVRVLETPGVWVAVPVRLEALHEPIFVRARLRTRDGLQYLSASDKRPNAPGVNLAAGEVVPGLPKSGKFFFELPAGGLPGARLEFFSGDQQPMLDAVVVIDLGLGKTTAADVLALAHEEVDLRP
jgi:hypothetical protein